MPKKIKLESFRYHFLSASRTLNFSGDVLLCWDEFLDSLNFIYHMGKVVVTWDTGSVDFVLNDPLLYTRGDSIKNIKQQFNMGVRNGGDLVKDNNHEYFRSAVISVAEKAGYVVHQKDSLSSSRYDKERVFHDSWANSENAYEIDVLEANEACTSPEMRYITHKLGDIKGKTLLDVGCGLGEASTYFALKGASVTSMDISGGMLDATHKLAERYGVKVTTHQSAAEELLLPTDKKFDFIYAGNLLHHVDILQTVKLLKTHLAPGGALVTWDPLAYNPVINVYRSIATKVRTEDEHPLKWLDIKGICKLFPRVETRYFWLSTLIIFLIMALVQRRNPNKERFWKSVVGEGEKWAWLYLPLERLDRLLLSAIPPLRLLCWNVVIIAYEN